MTAPRGTWHDPDRHGEFGPDADNRRVPLLCTPSAEWVPTLDARLWLYDDLPRVRTPEEVRGLPRRMETEGMPRSAALRVER